MGKKLTGQIVNQRLTDAGRKDQMVNTDDYVDSHTKVAFHCENGHTYISRPYSVVNGGHGCPECRSLSMFRGTDTFTEELHSRGISIIDYRGMNMPAAFHCDTCGHDWVARADGIINNGNCCPNCNRLSQFRSVESFAPELRNRGISIRDYSGMKNHATFYCEKCEQDWTAKASSVINMGCGCPSCANYGFDPNKPATLYLILFDISGVKFLKYGITNNTSSRYSKHGRQGEVKILLEKQFQTGDHAKKIEKQVKYKFGGGWVSKEILPDGWSETLCISHLQEVADFIDGSV